MNAAQWLSQRLAMPVRPPRYTAREIRLQTDNTIINTLSFQSAYTSYAIFVNGTIYRSAIAKLSFSLRVISSQAPDISPLLVVIQLYSNAVYLMRGGAS